MLQVLCSPCEGKRPCKAEMAQTAFWLNQLGRMDLTMTVGTGNTEARRWSANGVRPGWE